MAFPFYPLGAITAALVLGGSLCLFRLLLLALDRGAAELRGSIGPGLVRGVRAWVADPGLPDSLEPAPALGPGIGPHFHVAASLVSPPPGGAALEELAVPSGLSLEAVRRGRR